MSAPGRLVLINWDSIEIAAKTKTITLGGEPLDVTDDRSTGWRILIAEVGVKDVTISFAGITKTSELRLKNNTIAAATVTFPSPQGAMTGSFALTGYEDTAEHDGLIEFSAELRSTGVVANAADAG